MVRRGLPFAVTMLLVWSIADLEAQLRHRIADAPLCGTCTVTVQRTTVIYDRDGHAGLSSPTPQDVLRTSSGKLVVISTNPAEALLFNEGGDFVKRLGRAGQGPGEYRSPRSAIQGVGDTVWIVDSGLQRRTAWSPDGAYLGAQHRIPSLLVDAVMLPNRSWVLSGPGTGATSIGLPLHLVGDDGTIAMSFGPEIDVNPTGHLPGWIRRRLADAADGNFWAVWRYEYSLEKYDSQGELRQVIERDAPWFSAGEPGRPGRLDRDGPAAAVVGMVENDEGLAKVLVTVPGRNWREGLGERELQPGFEAAGVYWTPIRDYDKVYGFVIEIIDVRRRELLYRRRFNGLALGWVDHNHFATYREDEWAIPVIEIHRVSFTDSR
ncbi:MAG TPA: 6-bladed beta-propeller [Longimicrobiales bacterium]|nr:6-bladed beta-propeller [Longimicrobiales bacterium]